MGTSPQTRRRVLVIDDQQYILEFIEETLRDAGYDVISVSTGMEGRHRIFSESDLYAILCDIHLPDLPDDFGGTEIAKEMREKGVKTPIIFMTGHDAGIEKAGQLTRELSPVAFLSKPFPKGDLLASIEVNIARFEKERSS